MGVRLPGREPVFLLISCAKKSLALRASPMQYRPPTESFSVGVFVGGGLADSNPEQPRKGDRWPG